MLKIVHLNPTKTWRGGEQQTLYLAKYLQNQKDIKQWIVGTPNSELEKKCNSLNLPFHRIPIKGEFDIFSAYQLAKFIKENQIQIVHCHTAKAHTIGLLAKKITKLNHYNFVLIVSRRVDFSLKKYNLNFLNFFSNFKYFSKDIDHYIAISQNVKNILLKDRISEDKISVIYSGIDLEKFKTKITSTRKKELKKEFQIKNEIVIGNIAALVDHKDHRTLLKAIGLLNKEKDLPEWKLVLVGDGPLYQDLIQLTSELQVQNKIHFAGFRKDVFEILQIFDIFVMSSKEEGLGTSILDAMVYGLPIVATRGGGIPEIVKENQGGLLSSIKNAEELALNLKTILTNPKMRKEFSEFNLRFVKQFSYQNTGEQTLKLYYKLLN